MNQSNNQNPLSHLTVSVQPQICFREASFDFYNQYVYK